ncbi:spore germination protein [Brevibacillus ruminantium]|uniref:Spore germination protein n=1 Tax=Brevibacillus ruminantium TaxID=2950604 RepID=A0ABY4WHH0_9BACL|nr:GerAB/ArcD/ProY family transporter [Brevibacillus ruminantium]USG66309.1 spore germination protein [Brevibacillus ruminantium]
MKVNVQHSLTTTIAPYMVGFLIFANQVGLGMLGYQRPVAARAGHDAWISVIIAGLISHLAVWVICRTLQKYPSADLFGIHQDVYGKFLGRLLSLMYILYFSGMTLIFLRGYIEVVQSWMFPQLATWLLGIILVFLTLYTVLGGIRIITGYVILSVFITIWLFFDLYFTLHYARWYYLLPILEADFRQLIAGALVMAFTSVGYEILYIVYPYVQDKKRIHRSAQLGVLCTNIIYIAVMVITLVFFSEEQLQRTIWPTLMIKTVVSFPFLERLELLGISLWVFIVLPNIMLYIWSASKGCYRLFGWKQKKVLYALMMVIFIAMQFFSTRQSINFIIDYMSKISLYVAVYYPFILFLLVLIKQRRNRKETNHEEMQR